MGEESARGTEGLATDVEALKRRQAEAGRPYLEFLRADSMSAGLYVLGAGAADLQMPHRQDEIYVVASGEGRFEMGGGAPVEVRAGTVLFVPAGMPHRFLDLRSELRVLVVFAPPEE